MSFYRFARRCRITVILRCNIEQIRNLTCRGQYLHLLQIIRYRSSILKLNLLQVCKTLQDNGIRPIIERGEWFWDSFLGPFMNDYLVTDPDSTAP